MKLLLLFALALGISASPALAHPGHSTADATPWYRYLPPGAPLPPAPLAP